MTPTDQQIKERRWLEVFEERAHKALLMAERGWREFAETMRDIKESEAYKEAGYRYFQPYYRDRWEERTGRTFGAHEKILYKLAAIEEFEAAIPPTRESHLPIPGAGTAQVLAQRLEDPHQRVEAWDYHLASGRPVGRNREGLEQSIREYKPGVLERMEEQGAEIADYPTGPTPEEEAANAVSELARIARDVTPEAAADSLTPGMADTLARRQDFLVAWVRRYIAHLHLRAGG